MFDYNSEADRLSRNKKSEGEADRSRVGLCRDCLQAEMTRTAKGSVFYLCRRSENDPTYPKYPRLPMAACPGFEPAGPYK